ncbi:MAG: phosphoribosylglycinamide formyltransferase [Phycisphaerales bacterium]|nr:phosphoribosylglycinamide formyltransferase [Phycisphaerales bacterium]
MKQPLRLAVLLSGGGRTLQNLAESIQRQELDARIKCVISSRPDAYGLVRAANYQLPAHIVTRKSFSDPDAFSQAIWRIVHDCDANLVVLAGFMSLLSIPPEQVGKVINIHPALLPAFGGKGMYGHHVHEAVLKAGCKVSGCTVHFCDPTYDTGAIIVQRCCAVLEDDTPDTLAQRVFNEECIAYPQAIQMLAQGKVKLEGGRARIIDQI